jgi:hypothetical protein
MMDAFEELLARLSQDQVLFRGVEEATRQGAVLPVLARLGWDTYNIREVTPEHRVENRRVDYCLHVGGKSAVYVEVKRTAEDLERHERQLLEYAFADGVPLAVLTNGLLWWFYLPLEPGSWQQRKVFAVDIVAQQPDVAATHFRDFLARDSVASGDAQSKARSVKASREKGRLIDEALPRAWHSLFEDIDSPLADLLADRVEGICGHRPGPEIIAGFLESQGTALPVPITGEVSHRAPSASPGPRPGAATQVASGFKQQGTRVRIGDQTFVAGSVPDLYLQILKWLVDSGSISALQQHLPYATSGKRYLLATTPVHPQRNPFRVPVEYRGYYLEAHKSYATAVAAMDSMLRQIGLTCEETN